MARIVVIDAEEKTQVPFLRGILTRSLQDAGVSFDTAYSLASRIREELNDSTQVTTRALQALVIRRLRATRKPRARDHLQPAAPPGRTGHDQGCGRPARPVLPRPP